MAITHRFRRALDFDLDRAAKASSRVSHISSTDRLS
jgi:hypothetical protein